MITSTQVWPEEDSFNTEVPPVIFELDNAEGSIMVCLDDGRQLVFSADDFRSIVKLADINLNRRGYNED